MKKVAAKKGVKKMVNSSTAKKAKAAPGKQPKGKSAGLSKVVRKGK